MSDFYRAQCRDCGCIEEISNKCVNCGESNPVLLELAALQAEIAALKDEVARLKKRVALRPW